MLSRQGLETAYVRLERPMYNYLYRWFWDPETSLDLVHDAFERIWRRKEHVDEDRIDALAWTTVVNLARNRYRRDKLLEWIPLPPMLIGDSGPEMEAELAERDRRLRSALERLSDQSREILLLDIYSGVDRQRLAAMLDIPTGTLASRKHAAIRRLKELLDE